MRLPVLSTRELCRFLEREGFIVIRQKGSHRFFRHRDGRTTVVPIHSNKDIKRGLLQGILKEIKMNREEFFSKIQ
jgi:predicted RNA binding protein YcfA (HicA-like mRNA interferase family)|tara:strand:- start:339 stop:563 length:225 start_codon:yes stop_codon:yes gene_type:complete